jgi:hypothetical protein
LPLKTIEYFRSIFSRFGSSSVKKAQNSTAQNNSEFTREPIVSSDLKQSDAFNPILINSLPKNMTLAKIGFGTFIDEKGILSFSPNNILLNSNFFSDPSWNTVNCTVEQTTLSTPVLDESAWDLNENETEGAHYIYGKSFNIINSHIIISIFAKKRERSSIILEISNFKTGSAGCRFNLSSGAVEPPSSTTDDYRDLAASMMEYPGGWFRCALRVKKAQETHENYLTISLDHEGNNFYQGDGKSGVFICCAQMQVVTYQLEPGQYYKTQLSPAFGLRFSHDPITKQLEGLLIEASSHNEISVGESFAQAGEGADGWIYDGIVRASEKKRSPSGETCATVFIAQKDKATFLYSRSSETAEVRTLSCWIRSPEGEKRIEYSADGGKNWRRFEIHSFWRRYAWPLAADKHHIGFRLLKNSETIEIWGAQLERGDCATSYIPAERGISKRAEDTLFMRDDDFSAAELQIVDLKTQEIELCKVKAGHDLNRKNIIISRWRAI